MWLVSVPLRPGGIVRHSETGERRCGERRPLSEWPAIRTAQAPAFPEPRFSASGAGLQVVWAVVLDRNPFWQPSVPAPPQWTSGPSHRNPAVSEWRESGLCPWERMGAVSDGSARPQCSGDRHHFGYLRIRRASLSRFARVDLYAVRALRCERNRKRHQFFELGGNRSVGHSGLVKRPERLHRGRGVRIQDLKFSQVSRAVHGVSPILEKALYHRRPTLAWNSPDSIYGRFRWRVVRTDSVRMVTPKMVPRAALGECAPVPHPHHSC